MNRFIFGRGWVYQDEAGDGTDGGAGGGTGDAGGTADDNADGGAGGDDADGGAGGTDEPGAAASDDKAKPKDMLEAITQGLAKKTAEEVADPAAKKAADDATAAAAAAKAEKHANGAPKKDAAGNELDEKGAIVKKAAAPKAKTSAELALSKEQLASLRPESRARFQEVITTLKSREAEITTLTEQMKPLAEARDTITSILTETHTTPDQLSAYLEFNRMLQSNDRKDLESALQMIEAQRGALYKVLGKEPADGGVDLLADFADLADDVKEARITRERALELASARRERAANEARSKQQQTRQQGFDQQKKASESALTDITTWTGELAKSDIDYKAKEEKLLEQVDEVIKTYPPNQWLATLKLLYSGIVVQKAAPAPRKGEQPIRPSGAKPGAKAPQNMFEAMWGSEPK